MTETDVVEGEVTDEAFEDYWGTQETKLWYFPDKEQYMVVKIMNEGDRKNYEKQTSSDLVIDRQSQNTRFKMDLARDRHALIEQAVDGWKLFRKDRHTGEKTEVHYTANALRDWLKVANPKLVDELSIFIRKVNPWLFGEMTVEQVEEDIERLQGVLDDLRKREAGKDAS